MSLPDNLLRCMSKSDRASMGEKTAEEAMQAYSIRSEKELQKQIVNLLRLRGIVFLNPPMSKKSPLPIGWPDFTIFLEGGKTIFVECKAEKGKLTDEQMEFEQTITDLGYRHFVVRELREVVEILGEGRA